MEWLAVAAGGAAGALLRWIANDAAGRAFGTQFPWGILGVNIIGSLAMGILYVLFVERDLVPEPWRAGLLVGLLGAFTTFSTFSLQALQLAEQGRFGAALGYCLMSVAMCVGAAFAGATLARMI
ncbi:MAG: fluoride efflux transporter CrcB [Gammaproteobacteria bacterium]|nr:fluoride efflux transporter CrcB [Gammaproteobacteria bacterium]